MPYEPFLYRTRAVDADAYKRAYVVVVVGNVCNVRLALGRSIPRSRMHDLFTRNHRLHQHIRSTRAKRAAVQDHSSKLLV